MLARIRKASEEREGGFTLIELLVVIIIIGILAAIAIPVFLNQRQKGYDAQAKSDARNLATLEETYMTDNNFYNAEAAISNATTDLGYKLRYLDWHAWGENVGAGVTPYGLFKAYMASPEHRANMLSTGFRRVGISFVLRRGILWSTLIFYG